MIIVIHLDELNLENIPSGQLKNSFALLLIPLISVILISYLLHRRVQESKTEQWENFENLSTWSKDLPLLISIISTDNFHNSEWKTHSRMSPYSGHLGLRLHR